MIDFNKKNISLIVYDFDGVMTDNKVILFEDGTEAVTVNRGDGYGVRMIKDELRIRQIILSTEENIVVKKRAEKLKIEVIHGVSDKSSVLKEFCNSWNISLKNTLYIGNDLNDLDVMNICGFTACPKDAEPEIREIAGCLLSVNGGCGIARELYRLLLGGD